MAAKKTDTKTTAATPRPRAAASGTRKTSSRVTKARNGAARGTSPHGTAGNGSDPKAQAGLSGRTAKVFSRAERRARTALKDTDEAAKLDKEATKKAKLHQVDLGDTFEDLQTLLRLTRAYAKGDYRELPMRTMVAAVAAVVYFVSPLDAIPDALPGVGFIDDAAVLLFVVKTISKDLDDYRAWEQVKAKANRRTTTRRAPSTNAVAGTRLRASAPAKKPAATRKASAKTATSKTAAKPAPRERASAKPAARKPAAKSAGRQPAAKKATT